MKQSAVIHIEPPQVQVINLRIVGTRPLMTHALSEEDKEALRAKAEKRATTPRKARVPCSRRPAAERKEVECEHPQAARPSRLPQGVA